jgi:hypothetical protein
MSITAVLVLLLGILVSTSVSLSEAKPGAFEVEWQRQLQGISGNSVIQTRDGGYLVLGTNASVIQVNDLGDRMYVDQHPILLKTDASGNVIWEKTYSFEGESLELLSIISTNDGGFALGGISIFDTTEEGKMSTFTNRISILKVDSEGNLQWSKLLPSYNDIYEDVSIGSFGAFIQTIDGGYAFVSGFNHMMYLNEIWFVKANSEGDLEFALEVDSPVGSPVSLAQTDGGYAIVGGIMGRGGSGGKIGIVRLDREGNTLGYTLYGEEYSQNNPYVKSASPTSDGGYIIGGYFGVSRQSWIVKTDAEDVMVWDKTYSFGESYTFVDSISQTLDGGYIFVGSAQESKSVTPETKFFTWVGKMDNWGIVESQISFLGASNPRSIMETNDGGCCFVGTWRLNDIGNQEVWFVKFSSKIIPPTELPPSALILSPENKLYPLGNISLTYFVDETILEVEYSIDDQTNASLRGNTTIIGLPEGTHNLNIYAYDGIGNVETSQVTFTVGDPFPILLIIEIAVLIIVVAIASFILGSRINQLKLQKKE